MQPGGEDDTTRPSGNRVDNSTEVSVEGLILVRFVGDNLPVKINADLIEASIELLSMERVEGLSLRKITRKVDISHAAPYAHFADKQALIAAIAIEGYSSL